MNLDIMGPSFTLNITPVHSIALYSRVRSITSLVDVNGQLIDEVSKDLDVSNSFLIQGEIQMV
ncbi:hypothetical protein ACQ9BO_10615 [Flavobacterium sp. P21]|uniref:hypothetical protein n=1 Tax=Flavobacterium sp. P21 TaxID=3423948 RepID=UPI003D66D54E